MKTYFLILTFIFTGISIYAQESAEEVTCGDAVNTYKGIIEDTLRSNPSMLFF